MGRIAASNILETTRVIGLSTGQNFINLFQVQGDLALQANNLFKELNSREIFNQSPINQISNYIVAIDIVG